jgi:hypothetical protein
MRRADSEAQAAAGAHAPLGAINWAADCSPPRESARRGARKEFAKAQNAQKRRRVAPASNQPDA